VFRVFEKHKPPVNFSDLKNKAMHITGRTKHCKEHKGANLFKNTRISTRDLKKHKGANLFINTRISTTRDQFT